ncbi:MAG: response regulator [Rhodocyclales bacterium]|nr:response regulator [Rhodocyclales bacterium]
MNSGRQHILVVDDQPDNLLVLADLLGSEHVVHTVNSGQKALDYLTLGHRADLVMLDVMMPEMDGFEVCRRLKASPRTCHIPVLFLSSLESANYQALGLSLGAEDFLRKPFSPPVIQARVRDYLRLARAARPLGSDNDAPAIPEK